jgi:hypothetical protein
MHLEHRPTFLQECPQGPRKENCEIVRLVRSRPGSHLTQAGHLPGRGRRLGSALAARDELIGAIQRRMADTCATERPAGAAYGLIQAPEQPMRAGCPPAPPQAADAAPSACSGSAGGSAQESAAAAAEACAPATDAASKSTRRQSPAADGDRADAGSSSTPGDRHAARASASSAGSGLGSSMGFSGCSGTDNGGSGSARAGVGPNGRTPLVDHASAFSSILLRGGVEGRGGNGGGGGCGGGGGGGDGGGGGGRGAALTPESRAATGHARPGMQHALAGLSPLGVAETPARIPSWLDRPAQAVPEAGIMEGFCRAGDLTLAPHPPLSPAPTPAWLRATPVPDTSVWRGRRTPASAAARPLALSPPQSSAAHAAGAPAWPGGASDESPALSPRLADGLALGPAASPGGAGGCAASALVAEAGGPPSWRSAVWSPQPGAIMSACGSWGEAPGELHSAASPPPPAATPSLPSLPAASTPGSKPAVHVMPTLDLSPTHAPRPAPTAAVAGAHGPPCARPQGGAAQCALDLSPGHTPRAAPGAAERRALGRLRAQLGDERSPGTPPQPSHGGRRAAAAAARACARARRELRLHVTTRLRVRPRNGEDRPCAARRAPG